MNNMITKIKKIDWVTCILKFLTLVIAMAPMFIDLTQGISLYWAFGFIGLMFPIIDFCKFCKDYDKEHSNNNRKDTDK